MASQAVFEFLVSRYGAEDEALMQLMSRLEVSIESDLLRGRALFGALRSGVTEENAALVFDSVMQLDANKSDVAGSRPPCGGDRATDWADFRA
ncbi:hypothetical protein PPTG_23921 [Phytophthora nicotianae INRA-310]|uniref:Uncharacterized protein n=1 Tax=Phytophthora nicotianae (strain INRA-310) TaxID=761204 RepID=W2PNK6_PHYN3|nr:hypothetical protein PPTG_23921 [Phytophthora nicotianae INRA-310]ETN02452.1 hypothetical protein PPTG_23921 [Phytophthora nicotianae INRA-310]